MTIGVAIIITSKDASLCMISGGCGMLHVSDKCGSRSLPEVGSNTLPGCSNFAGCSCIGDDHPVDMFLLT